MKYFIIAVVVAVFGAYVYGVAKYHGTVPVPPLRQITLDVTEGVDWQTNPNSANERLRALSRYRYLAVDNNGAILADKILTDADFKNIAKTERARKYPVGDQSKLLDLADRRYKLTNDIVVGATTYQAGTTVDLALLKKVFADGKLARLSISGTGETISIQPGTMLMVVLIFVALLCALKIVLFDPLLKIVDERHAEIAASAEYLRNNHHAAQGLASERGELRLKIRREHITALAAARYEVVKTADNMLKDARNEARKIHDESMHEIGEALKAAHTQLAREVPAFAKQIISKALGLTVGEKL